MSSEDGDLQKKAGGPEANETSFKWAKIGVGILGTLITASATNGAALIVKSASDNSPEPPPASAPSKPPKHYVASIGESVLEGYAVWSDSEPRVYGELKGSLAQSNCSGGVNVTFETRDLDNRLVDKNDHPVCKKEDGRLKFGPMYFDTRVTKVNIVVFVDGKAVKRVSCPRHGDCRW